MPDMVKVPLEGTLEGLALAMLAGARAIETNKRCFGAFYVLDPFGTDGGPYELSYYKAVETLRAQADRIFEMLKEV